MKILLMGQRLFMIYSGQTLILASKYQDLVTVISIQVKRINQGVFESGIDHYTFEILTVKINLGSFLSIVLDLVVFWVLGF